MTQTSRSKTYSIGDLHGRYDLLQKALDVASDDAKDEAIFVVTGDFVDRGPQSAEIIRQLREGKYKNLTIITLQGNHEDMMVQASEDPNLHYWWAGNGGIATLASYGLNFYDLVNMFHGANTGTSLEDDLRFLKELPVYYEDKHRFFVHAGVHPDKPLEEQSKEFMQWVLSDKETSWSFNDKHVVHGHMQYKDGPILLRHRSNFDTYAWRYGKQAIGVFEDELPGGPIKVLWAEGEEAQ